MNGIKIKYTAENGWARYAFSSTLQSLPKGGYRLSWKRMTADDSEFFRADEAGEYPVSGKRTLTDAEVDPILARLKKASLPLSCDVNDFTDGAVCSLSIEGLSSVSIRLSWCSCDPVGIPELREYIDWMDTCAEKV